MKFYTLVFALLFLGTSFSLTAQISLTRKITTPPPTELFRSATNKSAPAGLQKELSEYGLLETDREAYAQLLGSAPEQWELSLPATAASEPLTLVLERNNFFRSDFLLRSATTGRSVPGADLGLHYRGYVAGAPESVVALSLLEGEMTATITRAGTERLALGRVKADGKSGSSVRYALYPDGELLSLQDLNCATPDDGLAYTPEELGMTTGNKSAAGGCVDVFLEVDYDIYSANGRSLSTTGAFIAANFNEVSILYDAIDVNLNLSEMVIWDDISPYAGDQSGTLLRQFQNFRTSFNGDVAQLLSFQASGGVAVLDGLCHPSNGARMSFSSIRPNFESVPIYSWSIMVIAHELGHLLGSRHTHACAWNGNDTAIDNCPGFTEGGCGNNPIRSGGGSIMSYCHLNQVGIDFRYGFGPQPGAVIASRVARAQSCVQATCDNNDGGPDDDDDDDDDEEGEQPEKVCDNQTVYLRLVLDDFGMETTWELRNEAGQRFGRGGPYPKKQAGRVVRDTICVPDGCYEFTIRDSDFDGICCDHGAGNFMLTDTAGNVLGNGGAFDTLQVIDFCLPDNVQPDEGEDCLAIDFKEYPPISFGTNQDAGSFTVLDDGATLLVERNGWKAVEIEYDITENTLLSFWFRSTDQGEIHGIGFDDNQVISSAYTFRVYGTQTWGNGRFDDYAGDGQWQFFRIPVGEFYTGLASYLFFAADQDAGRASGNSYFRHVTLSEGSECNNGEELPGVLENLPARALSVYPNPTSDRLNVTTTLRGRYRVVDVNGKVVKTGANAGAKFSIATDGLTPGTYVLRVGNGKTAEVRRFTVVR